MKYLVMECHPAYAVLMDEESRFVKAANLHYEVGQTVTDPVLMKEQSAGIGITRNTVLRIAAAAACLLLISTAGFGIYSKNMKNTASGSVVVYVEQTRYEMQLNRDGNVIYIAGEEGSDELNTLLQTDDKKTSLASAFNTLMQDSIEQGKIQEDSTVEIILSADDAESYSAYKEQSETAAAKLRLNADVRGIDPADPKKPEEPPVPADADKPHPEPPAPKDNPKPEQQPAAPAAPPKAPDSNVETPPAVHPKDEKPEPPAPAEQPAKPPAAPEPPEKAAEPPAPDPEAENRPKEDIVHPEIKPPQPLPPVHTPEAPAVAEPPILTEIPN